MASSGEGWIVYSWIMLLVAGTLAIIEGIVALSRSSFFTATGAHYVVSSLNTWGWVQLVVGIVAVLAGLSVVRGGAFGRWAGITVAAVSIVVQLFWVPIVPFWALTILFLDSLVIYGLAVYGGQRQALERAGSEPSVRIASESDREHRAA
jgi:hypothetical protein